VKSCGFGLPAFLQAKVKTMAKIALIVANTDYADPGLAKLTAPSRDAEEFARVLRSPSICGFDEVKVLINEPQSVVSEAIDEFFAQKKPDDLLVLYFSGHGVRDEVGALYLAVKNTNRHRLRSTAVKSDFIRDSMDESHSKRQVLILDCCNSGAFEQGTKAATGVSIGTAAAFEGGFGRVVLTASDATQFAWEGDKVIGDTSNSLFTHYLVEGLDGQADRDGDGHITVDELYDYAYEKVRQATPKQTPSKFSSKQQGEIILRENIRIEEIKPAALSDDLVEEIDDTRPYVREAAVQKLEKLLKGKNIGLARSAAVALEKIIVDENTTRRVSFLAAQALESYKAQSDAQRLDFERKIQEKAEQDAAEKSAREEAQRIEAEKLVREKSEREAAEKAARERASQEIAEKAARDEAQRLEMERIAREKSEKEAAEKAAREKAEREVAEKAAREEAQRLEMERIAREKSEKEVAEKAAKEKAEKALAEKAAREKAQRFEWERRVRERKLYFDKLIQTILQSIVRFRTAGVIGIFLVFFAFAGFWLWKSVINPEHPAQTELPGVILTENPNPTSDNSQTGNQVEMIMIPAGVFTMGSDNGLPDELPIHTVYLDDYYIDKYKVSNQHYKECVDETNGKVCTEPYNSVQFADSQYANYPVVYVSWRQAKAYCEWRGARLPSEAEWEKAARGTDRRTYPWGEEIDCTRANYSGCKKGITPVDFYENGQSPYGVYDMAGNVWEWVSDWYDVYPEGDSNASKYFGDEYRVVRGGAWGYSASNVRSSYRGKNLPGNGSGTIGFRCVQSP
jgi:formylglycine-generating enzyme required for sulfatase activity